VNVIVAGGEANALPVMSPNRVAIDAVGVLNTSSLGNNASV
jgi:hypothetical protein